MPTLNLSIRLANDAMRTERDVREALLRSFTGDDYILEHTDGVIHDENGNTVGQWNVQPTEEEWTVVQEVGDNDWVYATKPLPLADAVRERRALWEANPDTEFHLEPTVDVPR